MRCQTCGRSVPDGARWCPRCFLSSASHAEVASFHVYRVCFGEGHAQLFRLARDGTVAMQVIALAELLERVCEATGRHPDALLAEVGQRVFAEHTGNGPRA